MAQLPLLLVCRRRLTGVPDGPMQEPDLLCQGDLRPARLRLKATTLFRDRSRHCTCSLACACAGLENRQVTLQTVTIPRVAYNGGGEYMLQQGSWHGEQGSPWTSPSPLALANRVRKLCCSTRSWEWRRSVTTVIHHESSTGQKQALCG